MLEEPETAADGFGGKGHADGRGYRVSLNDPNDQSLSLRSPTSSNGSIGTLALHNIGGASPLKGCHSSGFSVTWRTSTIALCIEQNASSTGTCFILFLFFSPRGFVIRKFLCLWPTCFLGSKNCVSGGFTLSVQIQCRTKHGLYSYLFSLP